MAEPQQAQPAGTEYPGMSMEEYNAMVEEGVPPTLEDIQALESEGLAVDPAILQQLQGAPPAPDAGAGVVAPAGEAPAVDVEVPEAIAALPEVPAAVPAAETPEFESGPEAMKRLWAQKAAGVEPEEPPLPPEAQEMMGMVEKQWIAWDDVPPIDRKRMILVMADLQLAKRRMASIGTLERAMPELGKLLMINRGFDLRGRKTEVPFHYESLDLFLAETWVKNPWLRAEKGGIKIFKSPKSRGMYRLDHRGRKIIDTGAFSAEAHEKVVNEGSTTLEHLGYIFGFSARYSQAIVAKMLGDENIDPVLAADMYGEHGKTGDAIVRQVPWLVDAMVAELRPQEKVGELHHGKYVTHAFERRYKELTADELETVRAKAKMWASMGFEFGIDPFWFAGAGATSKTLAALGQVAKAAKLGEVARYAKVGKQIKGPAGAILIKEAKALNKEIMQKAKDILAETPTVNEARKKIRAMLQEYAGDDAVKYMDDVVGAAWGKHGLTLRIPFKPEGLPMPAWFPGSAESFSSFRRSMRNMAWVSRRKGIRTAANLWNRGFLRKTLGMKEVDADRWFETINGFVEDAVKLVIPNYRYSMGRYMDWNANDAASRILDDVFGGAPIEAAGRLSPKAAGYQREMTEKYDELAKVEAALAAGKEELPLLGPEYRKEGLLTGAKETAEEFLERERHNLRWKERKAQLKKEIEELQEGVVEESRGQKEDVFNEFYTQMDRQQLSKPLADALMMDDPRVRRFLFKRFRKELADAKGHSAVEQIEPLLKQIENGKWPDHLSSRGHGRDPRLVVAERAGDIEEFNTHLANYQAVLDAAVRTTEKMGSTLAGALSKRMPEIKAIRGRVGVGEGAVSERDIAGELLQTYGKDFLDELPAHVKDFFPPEDLLRIQQVVTYAAEEFATMAAQAVDRGIPLNLIEDYYPGIYRNLDNIIPDSGPMGSQMGKGPSGFNPMMRKTLSSAQATAMGLNPERDIVRMIVARRLAHEQAIHTTDLVHKVLGTMSVKDKSGKVTRFSLGREISDLSEVRRGDEAVIHWRKQDKAGNWVEQDYAVPKYVKEGLDDVINGMTDPGSPVMGVAKKANTWFRGVLTSPNPGYHFRNVLSNTVLGWMGGVRDPNRYGQAFLISLIPDSADELVNAEKLAAKLKGQGKVAEAENLLKMRKFREHLGTRVLGTDENGKVWTYAEIREAAVKAGAINQGFSSVDLAGSLSRELDFAMNPIGSKLLAYSGAKASAKLAAVGAVAGGLVGAPLAGAAIGAAAGALSPNSLIMRAGRKGGEFIENQARIAMFADQILKGVSPAEAAAHVRRFLYDYRTITKAERGAREGILFYTWLRKNIPRMFEELTTRPGRVSFQGHLERSMERISEEDWKGVQTEAMQRYYSKMMGVRLPGKTKFGVSMLALDLPWRDLNLVDFNAKDLVGSLQSMMTPIVQVSVNTVLEALDKELSGFGKGKARYGNKMVEAPAWMKAVIPGTPHRTGEKGSATGFKAKFGFELRPDPYLSHKEGKPIIKEYIPEHVLWWFNQLPMMAFATKAMKEELTSEEKRLYAGMSYLFGFRLLEFQPEAARESQMFEVSRRAHEEAAGRIDTVGFDRNWAAEAEMWDTDLKAREAARKAGELKRKVERVPTGDVRGGRPIMRTKTTWKTGPAEKGDVKREALWRLLGRGTP